MSMWTSLEPAATSVEPGSGTGVRLRVRNTGDTVEEYRLQVVGATAGWARVEPDVLRLYPGAEGTAEVRFAPPRTPDAVAGPTPFGVRVMPRETPQAADIVEGQLTVGPFTELRPELVPLVVRGRWRAKAAVAVDNLGNQEVTTSLSGRENGDAFTVEAEPSSVQVAPGRAGFAELAIKPGQVSWFGTTRKHPFTVSVLRAGEPQPTELRGTYLQPSVLPPWALALLSLLLAALIAFVTLWFRASPEVSTQAKEKPEAQVQLPTKPDAKTMPSAPPPSPSAPPAEKPPSGDDGPKDPPKKDGGGGGEQKKDKGPKLETLHSDFDPGGYLEVKEGQQKDGTYVGQSPDLTGDKYGRNQLWIIHRYAEDNTVALEAGNAPGKVLDKNGGSNIVSIWHADPQALKSGQLPANQKWRLEDAGDGRFRLVNMDNNECLSDTQNDKSALTGECGKYGGQKWKIENAK
ncbi:RICIN domain-containing protein [Streptomyces celluloflavus]|uniref:RICIN domain-containing protein n=1 Tax=Streptomyces celluloflavus TaxID=58344 RepID=A0ABW7RGY8_9ACTN|nr:MULTISPECIES: RICIN domain-containing protein [Streptomyces]MYU50613.1 hydrogenase expression protein [Streptomyces sp. SID7805]WSK13817.1 RICIN domain-containing protein [Streptomyces celluloflavus]